MRTVPVLRALSLFDHFQPFAVGVVEVRDVFYFLMLAGAFVWGDAARAGGAAVARAALTRRRAAPADRRGDPGAGRDLLPRPGRARSPRLAARSHAGAHATRSPTTPSGVLGDAHAPTSASSRSSAARTRAIVIIRDLLRQFELRSSARAASIPSTSTGARRWPASTTSRSYGALVVESGGRRRVVTSPHEDVLDRRHPAGDATGAPDRSAGCSGTARAISRASIAHRGLQHRAARARGRVLRRDARSRCSAATCRSARRRSSSPDRRRTSCPRSWRRSIATSQRPGQVLVLLDPYQAPALAAVPRALPPAARAADVVVDPDARLYGGEYLTMQLDIRPRLRIRSSRRSRRRRSSPARARSRC